MATTHLDEIERGSLPMPSPPPPPMPRQPTLSGETTEAQRDRYRRELAVLRPLADRVSLLELDVGKAPDPSTRPPFLGSGMRRTLAEILGELAEIKAIVLRGEASRAAVSSRAWWAVWIVVAVLLGILTTAAVSVATRVRIVSAEQTRGNVLGQR